MSFLYRFLKGKRVPSHQKFIVSLKENKPLLIKLSQFCIKNDHFVEGFMNFLNLPCSAALKKAAPCGSKVFFFILGCAILRAGTSCSESLFFEKNSGCHALERVGLAILRKMLLWTLP